MRSIVIFLNNKLITCDTIVPLVFDLIVQRPEYRALFVTFDERTHEAIQRNVVLATAIDQMGALRMMGFTGKGLLARIGHRLRILGWIAGLLVAALMGNVTFLHFKALNFWPLRLLGLLVPWRTIYAQGSAFGVSALERKVSEAIKTRRYVLPVPTGRYWLAFNDRWDEVQRKPPGRTLVTAPPPYCYAAWQAYMRLEGDRLFSDALARTSHPDSPVVASLILSSLDNDGVFDHRGRHLELLDEVLAVMAKVHPTIPVMIKPHPATRPEIMAEVRRRLANASLSHTLCEIHPLILAQRSVYAVALGYTTAFGFFRALGVPTVEYAYYRSDLLEMTGGGSMRPDLVTHFHQGEPDALASTLANLCVNRGITISPLQSSLDVSAFGRAFA